jgi:hypothetical protein
MISAPVNFRKDQPGDCSGTLYPGNPVRVSWYEFDGDISLPGLAQVIGNECQRSVMVDLTNSAGNGHYSGEVHPLPDPKTVTPFLVAVYDPITSTKVVQWLSSHGVPLSGVRVVHDWQKAVAALSKSRFTTAFVSSMFPAREGMWEWMPDSGKVLYKFMRLWKLVDRIIVLCDDQEQLTVHRTRGDRQLVDTLLPSNQLELLKYHVRVS